uniref:Uncharacterized protein n=1 Tax=Sphaerodactylus townsendi TaxID=933632 RepID=A0ACB8E9Q7_9SAUR
MAEAEPFIETLPQSPLLVFSGGTTEERQEFHVTYLVPGAGRLHRLRHLRALIVEKDMGAEVLNSGGWGQTVIAGTPIFLVHKRPCGAAGQSPPPPPAGFCRLLASSQQCC